MSFAVRRQSAPRCGWLAIAILALSTLAAPALADARKPVPALVVMRSDLPGVEARFAREVDLVLAETLSRSGQFAARFSPIPYADVKLAAGCGDRDVECLERIAGTVGSEWLLVRELFRDAQGNPHLTLMAQDGRDGVVSRRATAPLTSGASAQVVPLLVARLYNLSSVEEPVQMPVALAQPTQSARADGSERTDLRAVFGWSSLVGGAALLSTGVVYAVLSERNERAYADHEIRLPSDVDRAEELLARSEHEAKLANGLMIGGAGLAALGTGLLLWRHFSPRKERSSALRWGATPVHGGAALLVGGETSGSKR